VGKNKLAKWAELKTFNNVIQPGNSAQFEKDHPLKGNWNEKIFCNNNSITVELGCGKGEYTVGLALRYPDRNFIGVDIKEQGCGEVQKLPTKIKFRMQLSSGPELNS